MKFRFEITGLDCPNCAAKLADMIAKNEGIDSAKINFIAEKLTIESSLTEAEVFALASSSARAFSPDVEIAK